MFQKDAHTQIENQYGLKGLRSQVDLSAFDAMVGFNVTQLENAILTGLGTGVLRPENLTGKCVDFGCGRGVSTAALASYGGDVTGVELDPKSIAQGRLLGFVPSDKILNLDGIDYLKSLPPNSLDFVNAAMLGPDIDGPLCRNFLLACQHALKPGGAILVTSDFGTMSTLAEVNPLSNGFVQGGVFLAIRGLEDPASAFGGNLHGLQMFEKAPTPNFGELFKGLDLGALAKKFRLEG
ncbi:MAG: class I SAM-dependent methyltransferase [Deltaproteobacteria bacterium]|nr:class I SAM-dependent methyltransferase [Deltaproteobacteria bacterium]